MLILTLMSSSVFSSLKLILLTCYATLGIVSNINHKKIKLGNLFLSPVTSSKSISSSYAFLFKSPICKAFGL